MDGHTLLFMGLGHPETMRGRIYSAPDPDEVARRDFVRQLAGPGVIDCPAFDGWVAALQARGWLPAAPTLEPNPDGPGRVGRWQLTPAGLEAWRSIEPG